MKTKWLLLALGIVLAALSTAVQAEIMTIYATQDTYIRSKPSADQGQTNDGNGVRIANISSSDRTEGLYQFDLSGLDGEIISAHIELYDTGNGDNQGSTFAATHYFLVPEDGATDTQLIVTDSGSNVVFDKDGMYEEYASLTAYNDAKAGYWEEDPNGTMPINIDANNTIEQYYASSDASSTGLDVLNACKDDKGYVILLGWHGSGVRLFGDQESGYAPILVVETIPEPASVMLIGMGLLGMVWYGRRRK